MPTSLPSLKHYDFIQISGPDSMTFLQGQLSCNTELLSANRSLTGALCNLKGRVIADFRLLQHGEDCIMQCARGMAGAILTTLGKYAVFSKVELQQLAEEAPRVVGLLGKEGLSSLTTLGITPPASVDEVVDGKGYSAIRLPGPQERIELWFYDPVAQDEFIASAQVELNSDAALWHHADIESGIVHVSAGLSEEYTPQLLNYDISGLIDFKKGCYTGQEIVARMYYRGTAKKRLYLLSSTLELGAESRILAESDAGAEVAGSEILAFSNAASPSLLLAVLASEAVDSRETLLLSDKAESQLRVLSLPYAEKAAS